MRLRERKAGHLEDADVERGSGFGGPGEGDGQPGAGRDDEFEGVERVVGGPRLAPHAQAFARGQAAQAREGSERVVRLLLRAHGKGFLRLRAPAQRIRPDQPSRDGSGLGGAAPAAAPAAAGGEERGQGEQRDPGAEDAEGENAAHGDLRSAP